MTENVKIFVEHLERGVSDWLVAEYENVVKIAERYGIKATITNVRWEDHLCRLSNLKNVVEKSVKAILRENLWRRPRVIILDPASREVLSPSDFSSPETWLIFGGILGDHPPRGRTRFLLTAKLLELDRRLVVSRNLGPFQFPIDGSVYMSVEVMRGRGVEEIPVKVGLELELERVGSYVSTVFLPYAYPIVGGKPLISEKVLDLLCEEMPLSDEL